MSSKHGLWFEGAPHDDQGRRIATYGRYQGVGGEGRAACRCGALSPVLPSAYQRKAWHREHKRIVEADSESCRRCGGPNVVWAAPSPLWNLVMRDNDINGETKYADLVCIACFCELAEEAGVHPRQWRVYADPEPDGLVKVTPSGRIWNAETWLWVDPPAESNSICWCDGADCGQTPCIEEPA